jgi:hypothetical protein
MLMRLAPGMSVGSSWYCVPQPGRPNHGAVGPASTVKPGQQMS